MAAKKRRTGLIVAAVAILAAPFACRAVYTPYKIPSGAMMPTLYRGDHIFASGTYSSDDMAYGDIVVFRYPLDESEDFLKRVIAMPGDEVKIEGRSLSVRHAGEAEFETLERSRLDETCTDESGNTMDGCTVYEETHRGKTYRVRYMAPRDDKELDLEPRHWTVPEEHFFVLGDNRDRSHDSAQWTERGPVVVADQLLTVRDLRKLTAENRFREDRTSSGGTGPDHRAVTYLASHRSKSHDLAVSLWRNPSPSAKERYEAVAGDLSPASTADRDLALSRAGNPASATIGQSENTWYAAVHLESDKLVVHLECGKSLCTSPEDLGERIQNTVGAVASAPDRELRKLISRPEGARYQTTWSGRDEEPKTESDPPERVRFEASMQSKPYSIELEVWREPTAGLPDKLAEVRQTHGLEADDSVSPQGGYAETDEGFHFAFAVAASETLVRLHCRSGLCPTRDDALKIAKTVAQRAEDPSDFVDPEGERAKPFVPFDNIKGRVDRIWLPFDRFWTKVE